MIVCFLLESFIVDRARCKWTDRSAVEVNIQNERRYIVVSTCFKNLKFGNFTWSFGRLCQRIVLKCVLHVQHDYISSLDQSGPCFLVWSLPLPSSLLKLPIIAGLGAPRLLALTRKIRVNAFSNWLTIAWIEVAFCRQRTYQWELVLLRHLWRGNCT